LRELLLLFRGFTRFTYLLTDALNLLNCRYITKQDVDNDDEEAEESDEQMIAFCAVSILDTVQQYGGRFVVPVHHLHHTKTTTTTNTTIKKKKQSCVTSSSSSSLSWKEIGNKQAIQRIQLYLRGDLPKNGSSSKQFEGKRKFEREEEEDEVEEERDNNNYNDKQPAETTMRDNREVRFDFFCLWFCFVQRDNPYSLMYVIIFKFSFTTLSSNSKRNNSEKRMQIPIVPKIQPCHNHQSIQNHLRRNGVVAVLAATNTWKNQRLKLPMDVDPRWKRPWIDSKTTTTITTRHHHHHHHPWLPIYIKMMMMNSNSWWKEKKISMKMKMTRITVSPWQRRKAIRLTTAIIIIIIILFPNIVWSTMPMLTWGPTLVYWEIMKVF
jgi:hypothetical protein